jgi:hypothetical protein
MRVHKDEFLCLNYVKKKKGAECAVPEHPVG